MLAAKVRLHQRIVALPHGEFSYDVSKKGNTITIKHLPYDADEMQDRRWQHEHYWKERALQLLRQHVANPKGLRLLDYGCGRGEFLAMAANAGFDTIGLDIDAQCVELSKQYGEASLISSDDYLESLPGDSVDVISCFHVLEHVENPKRLLTSMRRVSRRFVLLAVPNLRCFQKWNMNKPEVVNEGHLQGWDRETLRNLAERHCNLKLVAFTSDMTKLPSVGSRIARLFGPVAEAWINLKVFSRLWPRQCISIIALFEAAKTE